MPAGSYDLVVNAGGRVTAVMTGVPVVTTGYTYIGSDTARITPPTAATVRTAGGTVATGVTPIDATVTVQKVFTGGPTVEVAARPVDSVGGTFSFTLPVEQPVKGAYLAAPALPAFVADTTVPSGKYTLTATSGSATKSQVVDLTTAASTTAFVLP